jgi:glucose 1-dehydrogenase
LIMLDLTGKTALVTGSAQGIGKGCAQEMARAGATVILNDRPGSTVLAAAAEELRALGGVVHAVEADVFSRAGCEQLMEQALELAGRVDILVSNPAFGKRGAFLTYDSADFDRVIDATFKAGFHISQLAAQQMVARGEGGKIIFISSVHARMPFANSAPYGAAKAALNSLGRSLAVELCGHRINVNVIEPGWIDTPNERVTFAAEVIEEEGRRLPWGRLGQPEDIGRAAAFLASDLADYISGVILPVDGMFRLKDLRAEDLPPLVNP